MTSKVAKKESAAKRVVRGCTGLPRVAPTIGGGEVITRQSCKDECDIHKILSQYKRTGLVTHVTTRPQFFGDVSEIGDYREALERVSLADDLFMQLPAKTRGRFDNDPAAFLDFCSDPENQEEMRELGLLPAPESDHPTVKAAGGEPESDPEGAGQGSE